MNLTEKGFCMRAVFKEDIESPYETPVYIFNEDTGRFEDGYFSFSFEDVMNSGEWKVFSNGIELSEKDILQKRECVTAS